MVPKSETEVCRQGVLGAKTVGITLDFKLSMDVKFKNRMNSNVCLAAEAS